MKGREEEEGRVEKKGSRVTPLDPLSNRLRVGGQVLKYRKRIFQDQNLQAKWQ
jgi:hypothetical protein